jgi:hypothetical protein
MSPSVLRNYRVSLVGAGAYAVRVIAESRRSACQLAVRLLSETRSTSTWQDGGIVHVEVLDEYDEDIAA